MNLYPQDEEFTAAQAAEITANTAKVTANTANVTAAGALMDSELAEIAAVKALTGTNTGDEVAASDSVAGVIKAASVTQTNTGTATDSAVTPAGLAGSTLYSQVTSNTGSLSLATSAINLFVAMRDNGKFMARKTVALGTSVTTWADLKPFIAADEIGSDYTFNATTGTLTIATAGLYSLSYNVVGVNQASGRAGLEAQLLFDTGLGMVLLPQTLTGGYARFTSAQQYATASLSGYLYRAAVGDDFKIQIQSTTNILNCTGFFSAERIDD